MTIMFPWDLGPNKCDSDYWDEEKRTIVTCGYKEFHGGSHHAFDSKGRRTHSWMVSNV